LVASVRECTTERSTLTGLIHRLREHVETEQSIRVRLMALAEDEFDPDPASNNGDWRLNPHGQCENNISYLTRAVGDPTLVSNLVATADCGSCFLIVTQPVQSHRIFTDSSKRCETVMDPLAELVRIIIHRRLAGKIIKPPFRRFFGNDFFQHLHEFLPKMTPNTCSQLKLKAPQFVHLA